ncbi:MAG: WecB/TagA/CpsF family glycosyltransferase [Synechococcus sp.]
MKRNLVKESHPRKSRKAILGVPVSCFESKSSISSIFELACNGKGGFVCLANVHMVMESYWNSSFRKVLLRSSYILPDGMPIVWMLRALGVINTERLSGIDTFNSICELAEKNNMSIALIGSEKRIVDLIQLKLKNEYPNLVISSVIPLPFRELSEKEEKSLADDLASMNASFSFVSLGCPKQEAFMSKYRNVTSSVMIGVGGVFPIYAGLIPLAPKWVMHLGLEWLFRLCQEPKRLWKRYATTNIPFIVLALRQLLSEYYLNAAARNRKPPLRQN